MSELLANIAALSPEKRELLLRRLGKKRAAQATATPETISAQKKRPERIPLSFTQQRLWFIHQLDPKSHSYNMPRALRLRGRLDVAALERSLNEIVRRHEVLRTSYPTVDNEAVQHVSPSLVLPLPIIDLLEFPESQRFEKALQLASEISKEPFDLAKGPVLRLTLLRAGEEDHLLLMLMHHIITDVWSTGLLFREMAALYEAYTCGKPSPLEELPIQYADFAIWQRNHLQGEVLENLLSYWKEKLKGKLPVMQLPTDRPRPAVQNFRGEEIVFYLSRQFTDELKAMSRREGVTLFMTLLATFKTLLYIYSKQEDILVGAPIANRKPIETERLLGFFANTVVFRTDLSNEPTFRELLTRVREVSVGVYQHQDLPFEKLVEAIQPERNTSHTVVFQVLFALQNTALPDLKMPGLDVKLTNIDSGNVRFDLTLHMTEWPEGLTCMLEYSTSLFNASTITRMVEHLKILLQEVVADPSRPISRIPVLTGEELKALAEWNSTETVFPLKQPVHELIEAQVERTPQSVAVVFRDNELTYEALNRRANQLAHRLRASGVGPESLVAIYMERSSEMVVGILGALKAGAAYMPLDPSLPTDRLAFILRDTSAPVVLTQSHLSGSLPDHGAHRICLDSDWGSVETYSNSNPHVAVEGENLAYVIYTSGSTGVPKGVMSTHAGLRNRLLWMQEEYKLTEFDRVLQKTPYSFDVSVWEFLWPLMTGARLVMAEPGGHQDAAYLIDLMSKQGVTTLHFVPSMLRVILEEEGLESLTSLRQVICSGEALSFELRERFFERLDVDLHNLYGPTEASIDVTYYNCREVSDRGIVPIGKPIANTQIHILDKHLQPSPFIVPGELHIGGIGLARGYINRPDLTAEKFIPDPTSREPGARLYKTGDLARWLEDGNIEYLGRIDFQVKIRGFRIELGEIEAVLSQYPGIKEAVVLAREDKPGDKRLVAYITTDRQVELSMNELRRFAQEKLPEYMVPVAFVTLDALPVTTSGKIDRKALPLPEQTHDDKSIEYVAPRTAYEEALVEVWSELLGVERIGINDDFFDLGGHSLLGIQLMWKLRHQFGKSIPATTLFTARTVAQLAALLETQSSQQSPSTLVQIKAGSAGQPLFLIHPAGGQVMAYHHLATALDLDWPIYGLQSRALDDPATEHTSIEAMAEEYADAISRQQPAGPYYLLGWSMGGVIAVSVARIFEQKGKQVAFVGLFDSFLREEGQAEAENPLGGIGLAFGGVMAGAFAALGEGERQELVAQLTALPPEERVRQVVSWGIERSLIPADLSAEMFEQQITLANLHTRLLGEHSSPVIETPIHAWWARDNVRVQEGRSRTDWGKYTAGVAHTEIAEGNHFTIMRPPHCQSLAARLRERLVLTRKAEA
jgi:amino acid adenylation domain-containing protein